MSCYAVTGGAGFIGSHLVERLVRDGHAVRVLDDLSSGHAENLAPVRNHIELITGSAADPAAVERTVAGVEGIFHLAAISSVARSMEAPRECQQSGEVATLTVLDQARLAGVHRVVFSSSAAIYGDTARLKNAESLPPQPLSLYAVGKVAGENYCRAFTRLYPALDTVSLRYFNVFGPRQDPRSPYSGVISIFLRCARERHAPTLFGDGQQTRDFVAVENVVEANLLAMRHANPLGGESFNVGTGASVSLLAVWEELQRLSGTTIPPGFGSPRLGDIRDSCADIGKIQTVLGYRPTVDWKSGLAQLWTDAASSSR
jgi:UDP-glucose 4-epimerase